MGESRVLAGDPEPQCCVASDFPCEQVLQVVFADDWIFPGCLEQMVEVAEEHPSVAIVSAYVLEGRHVACSGLPYSSTLISGREICRRHFLDELYVFGSPNAVLYRADLVRSRDPFYNEANIHGDTEVCFALLKTSDFAFVHQVLTFSRVREGSLSTVTADIHAYLGAMLHLLVTYGPHYLTRDELEDRLDRHVSEYYRFLGKSLLLGREKRFWDYHRRNLTEAGVGFSYFRLAKGTLATLWNVALNPNAIVKRLQGAKHKRDLGDRERERRSKQHEQELGFYLESPSRIERPSLLK